MSTKRKARGAYVKISIKDAGDPHALAALQRVVRINTNICPAGGPVTLGTLVLDEDLSSETGVQQSGAYSRLTNQV